MSNFQEIIITTRCSQHCVECYKELPTGAKALAQFTRPAKFVVSVFVCDADCLAQYKRRTANNTGRSLENFLSDLSIQFN